MDEHFTQAVLAQRFPAKRSEVDPGSLGLTSHDVIALFESQLSCRQIDLQARILKQRGQGFYTIASSGHEGNAGVGKVFRHTDLAFLHYRSGAFMLERAKKVDGVDNLRDQLLSLVASSQDPIASGRHKVFGSVPLHVPPQTSTISSHLPKALGAAIGIHVAKTLKVPTDLPDDRVILCSFGDASLNHSTAQGALNTAQWLSHSNLPVPIVFICEDNGLGISVQTPPDWVESSIKLRPNLVYLQADGLNVLDVVRAAQVAESTVRELRIPVFLDLKMVRIGGHAGSDLESEYLTPAQIADTLANDPLLHSARFLVENGYLTPEQILDRYEVIRAQIQTIADEVSQHTALDSCEAIMDPIIPSPTNRQIAPIPNAGITSLLNASEKKQLEHPRTLAQMINLTLLEQMHRYPNTVLFGEDVAQKGGVYHVTAGLLNKLGPARVFNSLLDEQTILGTAIGFAHQGLLPLPEIQFLAYLHNAEDQLRGEAATLSFFSNGQYTNPMVVRIPGLAYQKGFGGHFHNDNSLAVLRDIPGLVIAVPSHPKTAAPLLRSCLTLAAEQQRVVVFIEPIALYSVKDLVEPGDQMWTERYETTHEILPFDKVGVHGDDPERVIISYGNGYYLARRAQALLARQWGIAVKVIDLRWLAPLPKKHLIEQVKTAKQVLIVDECRETGSISEALVTLLVEALPSQPRIKRLCAKDSFIPLGCGWTHLLPSHDQIVACFAPS